MATIQIVYWRDIPAQIIVRAGRKTAKRELAERFAQAIDAAAMRAGAHGTDDYLTDWRKSDAGTVEGDDLEALAGRYAAGIESSYDMPRLKTLIAAGGRDASSDPRGTA